MAREDFGEGGGVEISPVAETPRSSAGGADGSVVELRVALEGGTKPVERADLQAALDTGVSADFG